MKFEKDFDFESANAQFNKEEIDREFQDKLKLKGAAAPPQRPPHLWSCAGGTGVTSLPPRHRCDLALPSDKKTEKPEKAVNGEDKGDSGVETQNSEGNADEECDPLGPNCYYDKSKSFFDNISCDDTRCGLCPPTAAHAGAHGQFIPSLSSRKAADKSGGSGFPRSVSLGHVTRDT